MDTCLRALVATIETLRAAVPPGNRVLSVYLHPSLRRSTARAHLRFVRARCRQIRARLAPPDRETLDRALAQLERYLAEAPPVGQPGLAIFAAEDSDYFYAVPLPERTGEQVAWSERPLLGPMQRILEDYERIAVVVADRAWARLYTVFLGVIEQQVLLQAPQPWRAEPPRRHPALSRRRPDPAAEQAKQIVRALLELLQRRPFDRLLLAGECEVVKQIQQRLPRPLRERYTRNLELDPRASDVEVLRAVLRTAGEWAQEHQVALVRRLVDAALRQSPSLDQRAVLGIPATLSALEAGRVRHLLVAHRMRMADAVCLACGRLAASDRPCPAHPGATVTLPDLRGRLIDRAARQGVRVDLVVGEAAVLLEARGGVGGWFAA